MNDWNPNLYMLFKSERTQPSIDLMDRINAVEPINRHMGETIFSSATNQISKQVNPGKFNDFFTKTRAKHEQVEQLVSRKVEKMIGQ